MTVRWNIESIRPFFEAEGYKILSSTYEGYHKNLVFKCNKGHINTITWGNWKQRRRCIECSPKYKKTISYIRESFAEEGYKLLTSIYKNHEQKLRYICPSGHRYFISWHSWEKGYRCLKCSGKYKRDIDYIRKSFHENGYTLLSDKYENTKGKLLYKCHKGHEHRVCWNDWQQGVRCPTCANIARSIRHTGPNSPHWKGGLSYEPYCSIWKDMEYKEGIKERDNYKCLNPYCNSENRYDLTIHHIDYDKKNCSPSNLITVCRSCNAKANIDREWHKSWYQAVLKQRYKYKL